MAVDPSANSNLIFEYAPSIIVVPKYEEARGTESIEDTISRLDRIQSPSDRLKDLFISTFNFRAHDVTHEASTIRSMMITGAGMGLVFGGILNSQGATADYIRLHNADVFEGKYRGNRHFWDTLIYRAASKGFKYGFRVSLLMGAAGFISFGSITYRNKLYLPDWIVGFTILGGLSRLWLGSKAVAVGGLCGSVASLVGFGLARLVELSSGHSVTYFRSLRHSEWLEKRETLQRRNLQAHSEEHMKYLDEIMRGQR